MPKTEAQKRAAAKYAKKVTQKMVAFYPDDKPLLDWAADQGPFATYVKRLIADDMQRRRPHVTQDKQ